MQEDSSYTATNGEGERDSNMMSSSNVFEDREATIHGRVVWQGHNFKTAVYYVLGLPGRARAVRYHRAVATARDNAVIHRLYSELMGLTHHALRLARAGFAKDTKNPAHALWEAIATDKATCKVYDERVILLNAHLGNFFKARLQSPIYIPNAFGHFDRKDCGERWIVEVNKKMNEFQVLSEQEQRGVTQAMLIGEETSSWWIHDPSELGPLMAALRGYLSEPAASAVSQDEDSEDGFDLVFDNDRCLHAVQFAEELERLSQHLRKAATLPRVVEDFMEYLKDSVGKTYPLLTVDGVEDFMEYLKDSVRKTYPLLTVDGGEDAEAGEERYTG